MEHFLTIFFGSIGQVKRVYTLVDFYQYIKALEYLIAIGFFFVFSKFYVYINKKSDDEQNKLNH
ncbi:MAG TPA: hypothetical protein VJ955_03725 [Desulfuromonadales bacterium]|nr:hypothetical protein [Desulfuromonadales bacterium]